MSDRREKFHEEHADCPVRYRRGGADYCSATYKPCAYCADEGTRYAAPCRERDLSRARRRKPRDRRDRDTRDTPPYEDS